MFEQAKQYHSATHSPLPYLCEETVAEFKESIRFAPEFHKYLLANKLTLWDVNLPDDNDAEIKNLLSKNNRDEMLVTRNVSRYFSRQPPAERIHIIVFPKSKFEFITSLSSLSPKSKVSKELEGKLYCNIAHFVETMFPSWNAQPIADKIKTSKEFKSFLSAAKEKNHYDRLDNLTQLIIRLPLASNGANRCLDNAVMYPDDVPSENQPIHWCYIHLIIEQKVLNLKDNSATDIQLASYVREVFGAQPNHRFVLSFILCSTRI
ncbi:hypothetical protein BC938DRAFT_478377 [Jimgerdemannia flammicorona]|uniref:Uncharacterized protein n=1 Tax=Jimgerdemannia flammicorona TaxID=994334 RepID=A0A433QMZ2_9FUNG|nr:hypothetical protein BC938DRAFT_478377 [Jimgerdemannia flammicorona]